MLAPSVVQLQAQLKAGGQFGGFVHAGAVGQQAAGVGVEHLPHAAAGVERGGARCWRWLLALARLGGHAGLAGVAHGVEQLALQLREGDDVRAQIGLARHGVKGLTLAVYTG